MSKQNIKRDRVMKFKTFQKSLFAAAVILLASILLILGVSSAANLGAVKADYAPTSAKAMCVMEAQKGCFTAAMKKALCLWQARPRL